MLISTSGQSSIVSAALWLEHLLIGTPAKFIAVLAIAGVGAAMLTGRTDFRRAASVIVGCFVLFGAPLIAAGLRDALGGSADARSFKEAVSLPPVATLSPLPSPHTYDPYAGAAVPQQR